MAAPAAQQEEQNQQQNTEEQEDGQQQEGEDGEDEPEIPMTQEPNLDRKGQISQRTVEQKKKQDELVKADKRLKGGQTLSPRKIGY